jgi:hypothetical protein
MRTTRKLLATLAMGAVALVAFALPASAQTPVQAWYHQTHPTLNALYHDFEAAAHARNYEAASTYQTKLADYGMAHPVPGADRKGWERAMSDIEVAAADLSIYDISGYVAAWGAANIEAINMPVQLPGSAE